MITERIDLYKYFGLKRKGTESGYLNVYAHTQFEEFCQGRLRPAMLVMTGGGYSFLSDREKEPVAIAYLNAGYNAFTLDYSISPNHFPTQLIEGAMAVAYIRENAKKYYIDENMIAGIGFSAGGHLAGMLATLYDDKEVKDALKEKADLTRLNAVILSYAVLSLKEFTHAGTRDVITGGDKELIEKLSIENRVNKNSVPAFIWCTADDNAVPSECSLLTAMAYKKAGVPFELHVFGNGIHGISLATKETAYKRLEKELDKEDVSKWLKLSLTWLKNRGFDIKL